MVNFSISNEPYKTVCPELVGYHYFESSTYKAEVYIILS